mmetsp:Transcript_23806/g.37216  ORF Transcript_23806/g.37216 Transcript_23806/m.37216 type:complete len:433 (-) Transcript_23806:73-1371(-)
MAATVNTTVQGVMKQVVFPGMCATPLAHRLDPVPGGLEAIHDLSLLGTRLGDHVVLPAGGLRQRHEDGLDPSPSLQAEDGATVINQVEFHIPSPAHQLPLLLLLGEIIVLVGLDDWEVSLRHVHGALLGELEDGVRITIVQVIEEDSSKSTSLSTVLDGEVIVSPLLELRVELGVVLVTDLLVGSMEVLHVLLIQIGRGDVGSTTEPPNTTISLEVSVVEVHGGAVRVPGMHDRAETACEEGNLVTRLVSSSPISLAVLQAVIGGLESLDRHGAVNHRKVAASLLPNLATGEHPGDSSTAVLSGPGILLELALAIALLDGLADVVLGLAAHLLELGPHLSVGSAIKAEGVWDPVDSLVAVPANATILLLLSGGSHLQASDLGIPGSRKPSSDAGHTGRSERKRWLSNEGISRKGHGHKAESQDGGSHRSLKP